MQLQISAGQLHLHGAVGKAGQHGGHQGRARAGAAGQGFPRAPLPNPHLQDAPVNDPNEFHIRAPGKQGMMLDHGADGGQINHLRVPHEEHGVGIAHVDAGDEPGLPHDLQAVAQHQFARQIHGDQAGVQFRRAHIRLHAGHLAVFHREPQLLQAPLGGNGQLRFIGHAPLIHVFADAADGVAAHFGFAAIGVENAHAKVRAVRGLNEHQAVGARAEMVPRHDDGHALRVRDQFFKAVDKQIIVSDAVHLGKFHTAASFRRCACSFFMLCRRFCPRYMRSGAARPIRYSPVLITWRQASVNCSRAAVAAASSSRMRCS